MIPGVFIPVWREHRYLPLVLEQARGCPGPVVIRWQDKPWNWTGGGEPPSGLSSDEVSRCLFGWGGECVDRVAGDPSEEYTVNACIDSLREQGAETFIRLDTDYLFTPEDMRRIYDMVVSSDVPGEVCSCLAYHYWRDLGHAMGPPTMTLTFDKWPNGPVTRMLPVTCYHPSYVLTDDECRLKTQSWGHANEFAARKFLEKEWLPKNDAAVAPYQCTPPPPEIIQRLRKAGAL